MCCRKELKFGLCLEGTCNFILRGGGLISFFCSSQRRAINSSNSNFIERLWLAPRNCFSELCLQRDMGSVVAWLRLLTGIPELWAESQLCHIPPARTNQWICAVSVPYYQMEATMLPFIHPLPDPSTWMISTSLAERTCSSPFIGPLDHFTTFVLPVMK